MSEKRSDQIQTCVLCKDEIDHFHPELNVLELSGHPPASICNDCIDQFLWWQQERFARLFPTTAARRFIKK